MPTTKSRSARLIAGVVTTSLMVVAVLAVGAAQLAAASTPQTQSGSAPATTRVPVSASEDARLFARATQVGLALGFPTAAQHVSEHVIDGLEQTEYDEVTAANASGYALWKMRFHASIGLLVAGRLDLLVPPVSTTGQAEAVVLATQAATAVGEDVTGAPSVSVEVASGGWAVQWSRVVGAIPVLGDGIFVRIWPDGRIASVANRRHPLAAQPAVVMQASDAERVVSQYLTAHFPGQEFQTASAVLEWVGPNGAFDASRPIVSDWLLRLAWVVPVTPTGPTSLNSRVIVLYVDAGSGALLGGDSQE